MNLYHYTDAAGLLGILNYKKLWATNAKFMNDRQEMKYGNTFISNVIREYIISQKGSTKKYLIQILDYFKSFHKDATVFLSCFCENGDLLSQWRSYASDGQGFSIGLELNTLKRLPYKLKKVEYLEEEQRHTIQKILNTVHEKEQNRDNLFSILNQLEIQSCFLKHPSFSEEQEWRLIDEYFDYMPGMGPNYMDLKFRVSRGKIIPYKEFVLPIIEGQWNNNIIDIMSITHGPVNDPEQVAEMMMWLMWDKGYQNKKGFMIQASNSPYR